MRKKLGSLSGEREFVVCKRNIFSVSSRILLTRTHLSYMLHYIVIWVNLYALNIFANISARNSFFCGHVNL